MTADEHVATMATAIKQAIKAMADRFGSAEEKVAKVIRELRASLQGAA